MRALVPAETIRRILREQRENYLPLRVIKDRIDSGEIDPTGDHARPAAMPRGIKNVSETIDVPRPDAHPSAGRARTAVNSNGECAVTNWKKNCRAGTSALARVNRWTSRRI